MLNGPVPDSGSAAEGNVRPELKAGSDFGPATHDGSHVQ